MAGALVLWTFGCPSGPKRVAPPTRRSPPARVFWGREIVGHPALTDRSPELEQLLTLAPYYDHMDPFRSLLVHDCAGHKPWCSDEAFAFDSVFEAALGDRAATAIADWRLYMNHPRWGSLQLLAVVNRMDLASWDSQGARWKSAELRFVYGPRPPADSTLIVEFVLPDLTWGDFKAVGDKWKGLASVDLADAAYAPALKAAIERMDYRHPKLVRLRLNQELMARRWQLGEWRFAPGTIYAPNAPLRPDSLSEQLDRPLRPDEFRRIMSAVGPGVSRVDLPTANPQSVFPYDLPSGAPGMRMPSGVSPADDVARLARNMASLEQCSWCHTVETGAQFTHISNRQENGSATLSAFLAGCTPGRWPTIEELYWGTGSSICSVSVTICEGSSQNCRIERRFHDIARRMMFLAAVLHAPATPDSDAADLIQRFQTDFTH